MECWQPACIADRGSLAEIQQGQRIVRLQDFIDVRQASDARSLQSKLLHFAGLFGFRWVGATLVTEGDLQGPVFRTIGLYPADFLECKDRELAIQDPLMTQSRRDCLPFAYDQDFYVRADAGAMWEHAAPFGYRTGITAGLRLGKGKQLILGMDREEALPSDDAKITRLLADLQMLAVHCADPVVQCLSDPSEEVLVAPVVLTHREREALKWTAAGLKAFAVGDRLNISERTVTMHLQNAMRKLGCTSKHVAAAKAARLGLI